jgi:GTP-binding protein HflX
MSDPSELSALKLHFPEAVFVSAKTGENLGKLLERMGAIIDETMEEHDLAIPLSRGDVLASLHRNADVLTIDYRDDHARVKARIPQRFAADYAWFATGSPGVAIAPWPKPPSREAVEAPTTAPAIPA